MTKKKKTVWVAGILILITAMTGLGFAINSSACGFGSFHRHGFSRRGMPPFMHEEIKNFIVWRMDTEAKNLGLTDSQKEQYDIFRAQFLETMEKTMETRTDFKKTIILTLENETPDLSVMATEAKAHVGFISDALSKNLTRFIEFFNALDPAQKKTITDKIKAGIDHPISDSPFNEKEI